VEDGFELTASKLGRSRAVTCRFNLRLIPLVGGEVEHLNVVEEVHAGVQASVDDQESVEHCCTVVPAASQKAVVAVRLDVGPFASVDVVEEDLRLDWTVAAVDLAASVALASINYDVVLVWYQGVVKTTANALVLFFGELLLLLLSFKSCFFDVVHWFLVDPEHFVLHGILPLFFRRLAFHR
jgi:hypothetical protein